MDKEARMVEGVRKLHRVSGTESFELGAYRLSCLTVALVMIVMGGIILLGGALARKLMWTGFVWIVLGLLLFAYTYSKIFEKE